MSSGNSDWVKRDLAHVWHPCTQMKDHESVPMIPLRSGSGVWLEDFAGSRYLDGISSWWVNLFGHCNARINAAIAEQLGHLEHAIFAGFTHPQAVNLAEELLRRNGEIVQFVSFNDRAWHAGVSAWQGREACNDYSIGIECEGTDDLPYEPAQYQSLRALLAVLLETYPQITRERLVGHSDVAPGRKTDPGPSFDWSELR